MVRAVQQKAVTLLELILVMIVLCTVLAMAAPSLRGFFANREISDVSYTISALLNYASGQAVTQGNYYRFNYSDDTNQFWLTSIRNGNYELLRNDYGRRFDIPRDIKVYITDWPMLDGCHCVEFSPLGRKTAGRMRLVNPQENTVDIICQSITEPYQVVEYKERSNEIRYERQGD
ncbi:MAG: hypothetical protein JW745_04445 [Sedimentisphaerales bacterium]|nr:hypothetical protein [Sedimentisphaerales bacterium]MBN2843519.1 hypothetical protein [Sedimentisphaerales bacterium]